MTQTCELQLANTLGYKPVETGALLLERNGIIQAAIYDKEGDVTPVSYSPGAVYLTQQALDFRELELGIAGIAHTHKQEPKPSAPDLLYYQRFCEANNLVQIFVPILHSLDNGRYDLFPFVYNAHLRQIYEVELLIISDGLIKQFERPHITAPLLSQEKKYADILLPQTSGFSYLVRLSRQLTEVVVSLTAVFLIGWFLGLFIQVTPSLVKVLLKLLSV